jgi:hypothetical protein
MEKVALPVQMSSLPKTNNKIDSKFIPKVLLKKESIDWYENDIFTLFPDFDKFKII